MKSLDFFREEVAENYKGCRTQHIAAKLRLGSNVFIQGLINSFGAAVVAGFAAAMKLNTFTITTLVTLSNGISSYTAQNIGAHNTERVKKGFGSGLKIALLVAIPFFIAFFIFPKYMIMIFVTHNNTDVITAASSFKIRYHRLFLMQQLK